MEGIREKYFHKFKILVNSNKFEIICYVVGAPRTPTNFTLVSSTDTSIVIEWIPGYNGGHEQTFNIQYRVVNESTIWNTQKISLYNKQTYILSGLHSGTWYELRMFASNKAFRSPVQMCKERQQANNVCFI